MDGAGTLVKDDLSVCASSRLYSWALFYPIALCLSLMHSLILKIEVLPYCTHSSQPAFKSLAVCCSHVSTPGQSLSRAEWCCSLWSVFIWDSCKSSVVGLSGRSPGEGNGTHSSIPAQRIPWRGARWATVHRVTKRQLSDWAQTCRRLPPRRCLWCVMGSVVMIFPDWVLFKVPGTG